MLKKSLVIGTVLSCVLATNAFAGRYHRVDACPAPCPTTSCCEPVAPCCAPAPVCMVPYVGISADYLYQSYQTSSLTTTGGTINPNRLSPKNFWGWGFLSGLRVNRYFGMEVQYNRFQEQSTTTNSTTTAGAYTKITLRPIYLKLRTQLYWPFCTNWDVFGSFGVASRSLEKSYRTVVGTALAGNYAIRSEAGIFPMVGLGLQYTFCQNWGLKWIGEYTYQHTTYLQDNWSTSLALVYNIVA